MKPRSPRLRLAAALALAACLPAASLIAADAGVFHSTFVNDVLVMPTATSAAPSPGAITPTGTNWYVMSSKDGRASSLSGGLILTYAANSTAAGVQTAARFTTNPIALSAVGDSITATATLYTNKVANLAFGLYNSGGVDPLTTLANSGLSGTIHAGASTDGTFGWKGYRARAASNSASGVISARAAQTGVNLAQANFDVAAVNTGDFASPGPISIGVVPDSASSVTFADGLGAEYRLAYTITRSAADALTISYTIRDGSDTVLYSVSGATTTSAALPSAITSTFDSLAIGNRNDATGGGTISQVWLTEVAVTAKNSQVALVTQQPIDQSWVAGAAGTITVAASGEAPLSYQWYKDDSPISGATSATYTVGIPSSGDNGSYHVVVSNAYGSSKSSAATVNFTTASAPAITTPPSSQTVNEGGLGKHSADDLRQRRRNPHPLRGRQRRPHPDLPVVQGGRPHPRRHLAHLHDQRHHRRRRGLLPCRCHQRPGQPRRQRHRHGHHPLRSPLHHRGGDSRRRECRPGRRPYRGGRRIPRPLLPMV